jgi:hypothetical protein
MYVEFEYRDGANYKWNFHILISDKKWNELTKKYGEIKVGTDLEYDTDFGISRDEFHEERGYVYDDEIDHNLIEVVTIKDELPEGEFNTWEF